MSAEEATLGDWAAVSDEAIAEFGDVVCGVVEGRDCAIEVEARADTACVLAPALRDIGGSRHGDAKDIGAIGHPSLQLDRH